MRVSKLPLPPPQNLGWRVSAKGGAGQAMPGQARLGWGRSQIESPVSDLPSTFFLGVENTCERQTAKARRTARTRTRAQVSEGYTHLLPSPSLALGQGLSWKSIAHAKANLRVLIATPDRHCKPVLALLELILVIAFGSYWACLGSSSLFDSLRFGGGYRFLGVLEA